MIGSPYEDQARGQAAKCQEALWSTVGPYFCTQKLWEPSRRCDFVPNLKEPKPLRNNHVLVSLVFSNASQKLQLTPSVRPRRCLGWKVNLRKAVCTSWRPAFAWWTEGVLIGLCFSRSTFLALSLWQVNGCCWLLRLRAGCMSLSYAAVLGDYRGFSQPKPDEAGNLQAL